VETLGKRNIGHLGDIDAVSFAVVGFAQAGNGGLRHFDRRAFFLVAF